LELLDRLYRKNNPKDIQKLLDLCEQMVYYNDKINNR
jgi:cyclophilin family peptidyl-prolyl cis-trans isomerase